MKIKKPTSYFISALTIKKIAGIPLFFNALAPIVSIFFIKDITIKNSLTPLLLMYFSGLISVLSNYNSTSLLRLIQSILIVVFFQSLTRRFKSRIDWDRVFFAIFLVSALAILIDCLLGIGKNPRDFFGVPLSRALGVMGEPNYSALILSAVCAYFISKKKYILYLASLAMIVLLASRMAFLTSLALPLVMMIIKINSIAKKSIVNLTIFFPLLFAASIMLSYNILNIETKILLNEYTSLRYMIWNAYTDIFIDNPLTGIGYFNGQNLMLDYYPSIYNIDELSHYSHNVVIQILSEFGIIGAFFFTLFLLSIRKKALKASESNILMLFAVFMNFMFLNGLNDIIFWIVISKIIMEENLYTNRTAIQK